MLLFILCLGGVLLLVEAEELCLWLSHRCSAPLRELSWGDVSGAGLMLCGRRVFLHHLLRDRVIA